MEKICVSTDDDKIALSVKSARILNEFLQLGFRHRKSFVEIIQEYLPQYKGYQEAKTLEAYWSLRVQDADLNEKLQSVIDKLKNESL